MSGSGRQAFPDVLEWSGGPPAFPEVVERPSSMSGSGREALQDVRECSGVVERSHRCLGEVGRPSRIFGSGRQALSDFSKWLEGTS